MKYRLTPLLSSAFALSAVAFSSQAATVVFDNATAFESGATGAVATSTASTPNTFMGDAYTLKAGTTAITGFDLYPVNLSGTAFTALKLNIFVWGAVNTGTVSATAPAFSSLLGTYSVTTTGTYASGFFYSFEGATVGVDPGITLTTPLAITGTTIGVTVNVQGSTDGTTFASVNSLSSVISYGTPPTVGSLPFNGYYRNAASETNGNFTSTLRSLGQTNQGVAMRVYGNVSAVPEPGTYALMAFGVAALLAVRRMRRD